MVARVVLSILLLPVLQARPATPMGVERNEARAETTRPSRDPKAPRLLVVLLGDPLDERDLRALSGARALLDAGTLYAGTRIQEGAEPTFASAVLGEPAAGGAESTDILDAARAAHDWPGWRTWIISSSADETRGRILRAGHQGTRRFHPTPLLVHPLLLRAFRTRASRPLSSIPSIAPLASALHEKSKQRTLPAPLRLAMQQAFLDALAASEGPPAGRAALDVGLATSTHLESGVVVILLAPTGSRERAGELLDLVVGRIGNLLSGSGDSGPTILLAAPPGERRSRTGKRGGSPGGFALFLGPRVRPAQRRKTTVSTADLRSTLANILSFRLRGPRGRVLKEAFLR